MQEANELEKKAREVAEAEIGLEITPAEMEHRAKMVSFRHQNEDSSIETEDSER